MSLLYIACLILVYFILSPRDADEQGPKPGAQVPGPSQSLFTLFRRQQ